MAGDRCIACGKVDGHHRGCGCHITLPATPPEPAAPGHTCEPPGDTAEDIDAVAYDLRCAACVAMRIHLEGPMLPVGGTRRLLAPEPDEAERVRVVDLFRDGTAWRLYVGAHGVADWPWKAGEHDPRTYAEEVARCLRRGLEPMLRAAEARGRERGLELAEAAVAKVASIHRMRAQAFSDDSDRADSEAQTDDIECEETKAEVAEYAASRIRALRSGR